ncbi:MAG TPA: 5-oxoprolinase subunit PxpB [Anaeromyxobacteraceae bacterium]|nr:5-oxoprolinase subunit PxpB [Anaeromyxobacteraceae bacterium]
MAIAEPTCRVLAEGEGGLVFEFGDAIDPAVNARVHRLAEAVRRGLGRDVLEVVPTYRSLLVLFDPLQVRRERLSLAIEALVPGLLLEEGPTRAARVVRVPVCYGGARGPDLEFVAAHNRIPAEEVVALHASASYLVFMLGFTPGFPYLGGMSGRIAAPRLPTPRTRIPAGSVGIAGAQTGIYPVESPGGWRLIGQTPLRLFDPRRSPPFLLSAGDRLRFFPVEEREWADVAERVEAGSYRPEVEVEERGAP